ncbi:zinc finger protein 652-A-like isoform X2 [Mercenaria mercenaria]|uniref:zinc finger protein 652-A-like isoform X2 n=1 Tax=Mercenaria mercenaria TaxID=6596 RepID=UPI00234EB302|nr:zinc finger protein 652-A-like isoform X2 [Mercenaria mercenaria]
MERTSVNLETLKDVPGYRVILKTVLQSQIQQLVEQLSKHTEEEAVFLTASLGDGTISHIGSGVGKEFLQENDEVKSKFLAFCLKRHHEISTNKQSKLPKSQDQGPVPLKITGSSIGSSHRHSPYSTSFSKRRNSQRQPPKTPSDQSHNDLNETVIKENDRKILESVSIELAQDYENENVDEYDVTDNEGLSDDLEESDQKSNKIIIKNVTGHYEPNTHADTMGNNNLDAFIPTSNVKDEHVHTSESSAQINAGSGLQFGVCKDISSGVGPAGPSASAATGVYTDLQDSPFVGESILETQETIETVFSSSSEFVQKRTVYIEKDGHYCCDECDFTSNFTHNMRKHLWKVHQREEYKPLNAAPQFTKVDGLYRCEQCPFTSVVSSNLKQHIGCKHRKQKFKCGICEKTYNSKYRLGGHIKAIHENKKLLCHICSKQFNTRRSLNFHLRKAHEKDYVEKFHCKICDKYFSDSRHFDGHMNMHSGKKTNMCDICGRSFHYYCSLTKHRETCTGMVRKPTPAPKVIICDICGAEFTRRSNLNEHRNGVHGQNLFDRECLCGKTFKWRNSLRRHRQICEVWNLNGKLNILEQE